jgi:hypothetical protein
VYKSYLTTFIEKGRFDRMTRWLNSLTTVDISGVDTEGCQLIDDWLDVLDAQTELRVFHTSGTSGKLSFLPRTTEEWRQVMILSAHQIRDFHGPGSGPDILADETRVVVPTYRHGASNVCRGNDYKVDLYAKTADNALFLYPDARFSADIASLSGRMRVAEARGELGALELSPALLARRDQMETLEKGRAAALERCFTLAVNRFGGRDVYLSAMWPILYDWAVAGLDRGLSNVFGAGSTVLTGGGPKATKLPDNWRDQVNDFLGFDRVFEMYGTSETMEIELKCEEGNYHLLPVLIPYLLDPATGAPVPRKDGQKGRLALLDILTRTFWAGLVTGDEVTLSGWERPCRCGRTGPHLVPPIRRFGESEGGDDKIMCSGAPEAHDKAMEFLINLSG